MNEWTSQWFSESMISLKRTNQEQQEQKDKIHFQIDKCLCWYKQNDEGRTRGWTSTRTRWRVQDDEEDEELKDNRKFKNTFDKTIYRLILSSYHIMMLEMLQKDADPWPLKNLFIIGKGEDKRIIIIIIFKLL